MDITTKTKEIIKKLPSNVTLVAVSKTKLAKEILQSYSAGQRIFGENKIQEMALKWEQLPKDIKWHMIGHVQTNKVKYMAHFVSLIHGVDSFKLLKEIEKQAQKYSRIISCLIQIRIAEEETKFGLPPDQLDSLLENSKVFKNVKIVGLMGMATYTKDTNQIASEFNSLKKLFDKAKKKLPDIEILSMGMSGDYDIAIKCGSNMVRIGSNIFGARNY